MCASYGREQHSLSTRVSPLLLVESAPGLGGGAFTALVGKPDVVILAYNIFDDSRLPQAITCDRGIYTDDVFWWVTRVSSGGEKDYEVTVINLAPVALWISVAVYARD